MLPRKELLVAFCLVTLATCGVVKGPGGSGWAGFGPKSVYSRALGPPVSGMSTISVPYMPKSPMFPKFVDPKMMISKKTDMLSNMFGGLGPAAFGPDFKPIIPYGVSGAPMYSVGDAKDAFVGKPTEYFPEDAAKVNGAGLYKRGVFGPFGGAFGPAGPKFGAAGAKFGPMAQFGPGGPFAGPGGPFAGPGGPFAGPNMIPDYSMKDAYSRKRRSAEASPIANLQAIMDNKEPELESNKVTKALADDAATPQEFMPGMFSPFAPVVDPSMFIAKKTAFLDTLFKNIATSTLAPPMDTTDVPVPKSTIVPPSFWYPSAIIPGPTEYNDKVTDFLDKLFDSLKLNKTASTDTTVEDDTLSPKSDTLRSVKPEEAPVESRIARSSADLSTINAAKDTIVNSIMSELGDLKTDMMTTMNDLIAYEKTSAAASMPPKKPFKPFAAGPWAKPAPDVTLPFKQRMTALSQVFDMLTDLQKNITQAIQEAVLAQTSTDAMAQAQSEVNYPQPPAEVYSASSNYPFNLTLLDALKNKYSALDAATPVPYAYNAAKAARTLPGSPSSFWVSYPEGGASAVKREIEEDSTPVLTGEEAGHQNQRQYTRGVKMQMHQGYQSLPAGSIESVQAGGGSVPGHQGGGIKLLDTSGYGDIDKWAEWMEYVRNEQQGQNSRHSHNHH